MIRARYLALPLVILCNSAFALDVNCDYSDKTQVKSVGTIDGIRNYNSEVADYAEDKRVCAVKFDAKVGKKWYETKNFYVFGPDMSQTEACNKAKDKAKIAVLEQHAPQLVTSNVEHVCTEKTPEKVVEKDPKPIHDTKHADLVHDELVQANIDLMNNNNIRHRNKVLINDIIHERRNRSHKDHNNMMTILQFGMDILSHVNR
jgi:hypothetical protein